MLIVISSHIFLLKLLSLHVSFLGTLPLLETFLLPWVHSSGVLFFGSGWLSAPSCLFSPDLTFLYFLSANFHYSLDEIFQSDMWTTPHTFVIIQLLLGWSFHKVGSLQISLAECEFSNGKKLFSVYRDDYLSVIHFQLTFHVLGVLVICNGCVSKKFYIMGNQIIGNISLCLKEGGCFPQFLHYFSNPIYNTLSWHTNKHLLAIK